MRYVILRDDDTNALTPVACLERLYRPFLDLGLPVNLATIPDVRTDARRPDGGPEGFLIGATGKEGSTVPIASNMSLVTYLRAQEGFHLVQHGCHHDPFEFDTHDRAEIVRRLEHGARCMADAGLAPLSTFVAPHDRLSRASYVEAARRFRVISTGWFEWRRLPRSWLPRYALKKIAGNPHWRVRRTRLLGHPGCLLSYRRPAGEILPAIRGMIERQELTVLVTHWWEYFRDGRPDAAFIDALHGTARYLAGNRGIRVLSFDAVAARAVRA